MVHDLKTSLKMIYTLTEGWGGGGGGGGTPLYKPYRYVPPQRVNDM